ncbi:hypothetical protein [Streptosporangium sp. NPDC002524]|uniref:hypothetical protein n=1 Tax=Streptosporangium sp. NPDC002524 TaxID=3154537 RepID=UPI0033329154
MSDDWDTDDWDTKARGVVGRGRFDPNLHPRDRKGRFIESGAVVKIWGGARGEVIKNVGAGYMEVRMPDKSIRRVHRNYLEVQARPDGSKPTGDGIGLGRTKPQAMQVEPVDDGVQDFTPDAAADHRVSVKDLQPGQAVLVYGRDKDGRAVRRVGVVGSVKTRPNGDHVVNLGPVVGDIYTDDEGMARPIPAEKLQALIDATGKGDDPEAQKIAKDIQAEILSGDDDEFNNGSPDDDQGDTDTGTETDAEPAGDEPTPGTDTDKPGGEGGTSPAGAPITEKTDKPLIPNKWGAASAQNNEVVYHDDGHIGQAVKELGDDARLDVDGEPLANVLGKLATDAVAGRRSSQEVFEEMKKLRDRLPDNSAARRALDKAIGRLDAPDTPLPKVPDVTPQPLKQLIADLHAVPLVRREPNKELDAALNIAEQFAAGKVSGMRLLAAVRRLGNQRHESLEGKFEIDRAVNRADKDLEALRRSDRAALIAPEPGTDTTGGDDPPDPKPDPEPDPEPEPEPEPDTGTDTGAGTETETGTGGDGQGRVVPGIKWGHAWEVNGTRSKVNFKTPDEAQQALDRYRKYRADPPDRESASDETPLPVGTERLQTGDVIDAPTWDVYGGIVESIDDAMPIGRGGTISMRQVTVRTPDGKTVRILQPTNRPFARYRPEDARKLRDELLKDEREKEKADLERIRREIEAERQAKLLEQPWRGGTTEVTEGNIRHAAKTIGVPDFADAAVASNVDKPGLVHRSADDRRKKLEQYSDDELQQLMVDLSALADTVPSHTGERLTGAVAGGLLAMDHEIDRRGLTPDAEYLAGRDIGRRVLNGDDNADADASPRAREGAVRYLEKHAESLDRAPDAKERADQARQLAKRVRDPEPEPEPAPDPEPEPEPAPDPEPEPEPEGDTPPPPDFEGDRSGGYKRAGQIQVGDSVLLGERDALDSTPLLVESVTERWDGKLELTLHTGQVLVVGRNDSIAVPNSDLAARDVDGTRYGVTTRADQLGEGDWVELSTADTEQLQQAGQMTRTAEGVVVRGRVAAAPGEQGRVRLAEVTVHDPRTGRQLGSADDFELNRGDRPVRLDAAPTGQEALGLNGEAIPDDATWRSVDQVAVGSHVVIPVWGSDVPVLGLEPTARVTISGRLRDRQRAPMRADGSTGGHDLLLEGATWVDRDGRSGIMPVGRWTRLTRDGLYASPGEADPGWAKTPGEQLAAGDLLPEGRIESITRAGGFTFAVVRDDDDRRTVIAVPAEGGVHRMEASGEQPPTPLEIGTVTTLGLAVGDRILMRTPSGEFQPATVEALATRGSGRTARTRVSFRYDDGTLKGVSAPPGQEFQRLTGPDADLVDPPGGDTTGRGDTTGGEVDVPRPGPLPRGTATARPVLATSQRAFVVDLGFHTGGDAVLAEAAARLQHRMPLTAEHAAALADAVRKVADSGDVTPARGRALQRAAARFDAAAAEARGLPAPDPQPGRALPEKAAAGNLTDGDVVALPGAGGSAQIVTVRSTRAIMGGRVVEVEIEHDDGTRETRVVTGKTDVWLLPDLPDPTPVPRPAEYEREHVHPSTLRPGDVIEYDGKAQTVLMLDEGRGITEARIQDGDNEPEWVYLEHDGGGMPTVVRRTRGTASGDQPWDGLLPSDDGTRVEPSQVVEDDLIRVDSPVIGRSYTGTVTRVTPIVEGPIGKRKPVGYTYELRGLDGKSDVVTVMDGDNSTVTMLADGNSTYVQQMAAVKHRILKAGTARQVAEVLSYLESVAYGVHAANGAPRRRDKIENVIGRIESPNASAPEFLRERGNAVQKLAGIFGVDDPETYRSVERRLLPLFNDINLRARDRVVESLRKASPAEGRSEAETWEEILHQFWSNPPTSRDTMATAAAALTDLEEAAYFGKTTSSVAAPAALPAKAKQGAALADRMNTYREALGGGKTFAHRPVQKTTFTPVTLQDLESGRVPQTQTTMETVRDVAADGGPGEHAMAHLALVRAAGAELDAAYQAKYSVAEARVKERQAALDQQEKTLVEAEDKWHRDRTALRKRVGNKLAKEHGFSSRQDLHDAVSGANRAGDTAEAIRLENLSEKITEEVDAVVDRKYPKLDKTQMWNITYARSNIDRELGQARREAALEVLREVRADGIGGVQIDWVNDKTGKHMEEDSDLVKGMRFAERSYPKKWLERFREHGGPDGWKLKKVRRGFYSDADRTVALSTDNIIRTSKGGNTDAVAVHEMGHGMERVVDGLVDAQWAFLWSRTSTGEIGSRQREKLVNIYSTNKERGYRDDFPEHYTGKEYGDNRHYEVFTTGVESLLAGEKYLDDDFRQWMFGVMALL